MIPSLRVRRIRADENPTVIAEIKEALAIPRSQADVAFATELLRIVLRLDEVGGRSTS